MTDSLERTMMYLFLRDNQDTTVRSLNKSAMIYFYSQPAHLRDKMDISYFWGEVFKEWSDRQKTSISNHQTEITT